MRFLFLASSLSIFSLATVNAASVYWSFQNNATGGSYVGPTNGALSGGGFTSNDGFQGTPVISAIRGTGSELDGVTFSQSSLGNEIGPPTATTDPGTGISWEGGRALQWNSASTSDLTGAGFSLSLNTSGLTDLKVQFDLRTASAQNGTAAGQAGGVTSFSAIQYRTSPSDEWQSVGVTDLPSWTLQTGWQPLTVLDFSEFDFLEGQETLELQFIFNGGTKQLITNSSGDLVYPTQNVRIDNLLVTAVPEPSGLALLALGGVALGLRRRR